MNRIGPFSSSKQFTWSIFLELRFPKRPEALISEENINQRIFELENYLKAVVSNDIYCRQYETVISVVKNIKNNMVNFLVKVFWWDHDTITDINETLASFVVEISWNQSSFLRGPIGWQKEGGSTEKKERGATTHATRDFLRRCSRTLLLSLCFSQVPLTQKSN